MCFMCAIPTPIMNILKYFYDEMKNDMVKRQLMSAEKEKIAYIDGKPYEIGSKHTSILKFVKSYLGEKKVPTLCDDPNLAPYGACRVCSRSCSRERWTN